MNHVNKIWGNGYHEGFKEGADADKEYHVALEQWILANRLKVLVRFLKITNDSNETEKFPFQLEAIIHTISQELRPYIGEEDYAFLISPRYAKRIKKIDDDVRESE